MSEPTLMQIVEALLFSSGESLSLAQMGKILEMKDKSPIKEALTQLGAFYEEHQRPYRLTKSAEGYLIKTLPQYQSWIKKGVKVKSLQLSNSALETLSIVAYRQPVTRAEIEELRSVDCTYPIKSLLDKGLIRITGRREVPGRPLVYGTHKKFLEVFGLASLKDLPLPEEMDLLHDPGQEVYPDKLEIN